MSWNIRMFGTKSDVILSLPQWFPGDSAPVGQFIVDRISQIADPAPGAPWNASTHVRVEGYGHAGAVGKLEIEPINPVLPPPPPAPPISNDSVAAGSTQFDTGTAPQPTT